MIVQLVIRTELQVLSLSLSLSQWRKIGLPLEVLQESWPNFKGITKGKRSCHQSLGFSKV